MYIDERRPDAAASEIQMCMQREKSEKDGELEEGVVFLSWAKRQPAEGRIERERERVKEDRERERERGLSGHVVPLLILILVKGVEKLEGWTRAERALDERPRGPQPRVVGPSSPW